MNDESNEEESDEHDSDDSTDDNIPDDSIKNKKSKSSSKKSTKKQTKIRIARTYDTYFSIKLKVEKGKVPTQQLVKALKKWFSQLLIIDPTCIIYGYENEIPTDAIMKSKNIPTDISIIKKFFSNISVKPNGGFSWFQVWIGHDDTPENIIVNMKNWAIENETVIYEKRLEQKHTAKNYCLMWPMERMDTEVLHDRVTQIISQITSKKDHFSYNFGSIRKDPKQFNSSV